MAWPASGAVDVEADEERRAADAAFVPRWQRDTAIVLPGFGHGGLKREGQTASSVAAELAGEPQETEMRQAKKARASPMPAAASAPASGAAGAMPAAAMAPASGAAGGGEGPRAAAENPYEPPPHWDPAWVRPDDINGHHLFKAGPVLFCAICGAYGSSAFVKLNEECRGPPRRSERLRRLQQGKDPNADRYLGSVRRAVRSDLPFS